MAQQKSDEDRARREAKADEVVELVLDAIKAFLTGEAYFDVLPGPNVEGSKVVYFRNQSKTPPAG